MFQLIETFKTKEQWKAKVNLARRIEADNLVRDLREGANIEIHYFIENNRCVKSKKWAKTTSNSS